LGASDIDLFSKLLSPGYGAFSLGQTQRNTLIGYIDNQQKRHRRQTFQEEFLDFLHKYKIDYDERYVTAGASQLSWGIN